MKVVRLGDHAAFLSGFAFKSNLFNDDGNGMTVIRIRDVVRGYSGTYYSGNYEDRYVVTEGEYLIGMDGEFNLARWRSSPALLNQRVCKIDDVSKNLDRDYLARCLAVILKQIEDETPFVTVKHLSVKKLNEAQIPLPSLAEQKRIASILDAVDALRAKRREALAQLDTLIQSTFLDMFGDPVTNPMGWEVKNLEELCLGISDIDHKMPRAVEGGVPFISAKDLADDGSISFQDVKQISDEDFKRLSRKGTPKKGDIIYSRIGAKLGKARLVTVDFKFLASYSCCTIKPNGDLIDRYFLCTLLDSPFMLRQAHGGIRAIAVPDLGLGIIKSFKIICPPLNVQRRFAALVESVEQQRARMRAHLAELDVLFASLQARAFNGRL